LTRHYESLRQTAVDQALRRDSGLGLALFLRAGLTAWMQTCGKLSPPSASTTLPANTREPDLDVRLSRDLVNILVTMVLNRRKEQPK
jgi:hypothetical protein